MTLQRRSRPITPSSDAVDSAPTPGKETQVQRIASQGVIGSGGEMPFADQIAESFGGEHADTVRGIRAHTGSAATAASEDIGAKAYATGNDVAFAGTPDLHTAAHEAAHVVQQRQGVHLKGGVGAEGDVYERHADAVADRVVAGVSAASLLGDGGASAVSSAPAVQRKGDAKPPKKDPKKEAEDFETDGPRVIYALEGVMRTYSNAEMRSYMPAKYHDALDKLMLAKFSQKADANAKLAAYDEAWTVFQPFVRANDHFGGNLDLNASFATLRKDLLFSQAGARISNTMVIEEGGKKKAIEIPDDQHPHEQAEVLHANLPKLIGSMKTTVDRAKTLGEHVLKGEGGEKLIEKIEAIKHVLNLAEGWTKLNDEEFQHELKNIKGVFNGVSTYSELVKTILEMTEAGIGLTIQLAGVIGKMVGDHAMEHAASQAGKLVGEGFTKIIAGVEIIHGLATMLDSSKTRDERIEGGVEVAAGIGTLAAGSSLGALPVAGPYALIKIAQYLYSGAALGWEVGILKTTFKRLADEAKSFSYQSDQLVAAHQLGEAEKDQEKKTAMATQERVHHKQLADGLYDFLGDCSDKGHGIGDLDGNTTAQFYPGNIQIMREKFAGVVSMRSALKNGNIDTTAMILKMTMEVIVWCFDHAQAIVKGSALNKHYDDMDKMQHDIDEKSKPKEE
jgi:hypothetical protein